MRRKAICRALLTAGVLALATVLSGCENFDPTSLTDFIPDGKKKLPGERRDLFPGGVPGVTQGVPRELVKGNQPPPDPDVIAAPADQPPPAEGQSEPQKEATAEPAPAPEPKAKPKPKPKAAAQKKKPAPVAAQPAANPPQQADQTQWPAPPPPAAQQTQSSQSVWPAPPPAGQFTR